MSAKRLSKNECHRIAHKMTAGISSEIKAIETWFNNLSRQILEEQVPETIMSLFSGDSNLAKYIKVAKHGCIVSNKRYYYTDFDSVPSNSSDFRPNIIIPEKNEKQFKELYEKRHALQTKQSILVKELEDILYKLATPKRITEHLPEALPFLPEVEESSLPQINLSQFRQKLKEELGEIK